MVGRLEEEGMGNGEWAGEWPREEGDVFARPPAPLRHRPSSTQDGPFGVSAQSSQTQSEAWPSVYAPGPARTPRRMQKDPQDKPQIGDSFFDAPDWQWLTGLGLVVKMWRRRGEPQGKCGGPRAGKGGGPLASAE